MKVKTINVFNCEYCNKRYFYKKRCETHENSCKLNPDNIRPCFSCKNLCFKEVAVRFDNPFQLSERRVYFCNKKEIGLIPVSSDKKGRSFKLLNYNNTVMPDECEEYDK